MSELATWEAQTKAEALLIERYPDEFAEIHREICVRRGLDLVTVRRTIYRSVTPLEAMELSRHGWEEIEEGSL